MSKGFDVDEIAAMMFDKQRDTERNIKDYKRIKKAIAKQEQQELEDLISYENINYNVVQAILDYVPHMGAQFFAELFTPREMSSSFVNTVNEWKNDSSKVLFVNELLENVRIRHDKNLFDKLTTIAATIENKKYKEKLSAKVTKIGFYKFKEELFSLFKNKPVLLENIQLALQNKDNGDIYSLFTKVSDNKKAKFISSIEPTLNKPIYDLDKVMIEDLSPAEIYRGEILNVASIAASTIKTRELKYSLPEVIRYNKTYLIRELLNEKLSKFIKSDSVDVSEINKGIGKENDIVRLIKEFRLWHDDKSKVSFINSLPNLDDEEFKQIALIVYATIEKKKNKESIDEKLKEDYRYKIIEALGINSNSSKIDKYSYAKVMRDIISENLKSSTTKQLKEWKDDNSKINAVNKLLSISDELPDKHSKFVGELAVDLVQSVDDSEIKVKAPVYKNNDMYSQYFNFVVKFEKLEEDLKKNITEEEEQKYRLGIDPKLRFGIEIESEGDSSLFLLNESKIRNEGNKISAKVWKTETDTTLVDGVEVKSPVLSDIPRDIRNIHLVNDALKDMGQDTNQRCGAHVHFGANYLKSSFSFINLMEIFTNCEEIFYLISNKEGELPRQTTREIVDFMNPRLVIAMNENKFNEKDYDGRARFVKKVTDAQFNRNVGLNLYNVDEEEKDTVEFRLSNGTVDGKTWTDNIRLYGKLMEVSEKLGEAERKYYIDNVEPSDDEFILLKREEKLKGTNLSNEEKSKVLFDMLFGDDNAREIYEKRFEANSKLSDRTDKKNNPIKQAVFNVVDFKGLFNIKNTIMKNRNIDLIQTEKDMMNDLKEMEQEKKKNKEQYK